MTGGDNTDTNNTLAHALSLYSAGLMAQHDDVLHDVQQTAHTRKDTELTSQKIGFLGAAQCFVVLINRILDSNAASQSAQYFDSTKSMLLDNFDAQTADDSFTDQVMMHGFDLTPDLSRDAVMNGYTIFRTFAQSLTLDDLAPKNASDNTRDTPHNTQPAQHRYPRP